MSKVIWIVECPIRACTRLGEKPCSINRLAAAWRSECRPYFGFSASLMLAVNPGLTPARVKAILQNTALSTGNTDPDGNPINVLDMSASVSGALATLPQVTYKFTGVGTGSLGGRPFTSASFTFTLTANPSTITYTLVDGPSFYNTGVLTFSIAGIATGTPPTSLKESP